MGRTQINVFGVAIAFIPFLTYFALAHLLEMSEM